MKEQNHNLRDQNEDATGSDTKLENNRSSEEANSDREIPSDDGEKGDESGPPHPVGFWSPKLRKTRLHVFGLWARTSEQHFHDLFWEGSLTFV